MKIFNWNHALAWETEITDVFQNLNYLIVKQEDEAPVFSRLVCFLPTESLTTASVSTRMSLWAWSMAIPDERSMDIVDRKLLIYLIWLWEI